MLLAVMLGSGPEPSGSKVRVKVFKVILKAGRQEGGPGSLPMTGQPDKTKLQFWANFRLFSAHLAPIWYPILVINSSMVPICHFSACMFTDSAYFPPMFRSFSAYFLPNVLPILRRSCAGRVSHTIILGIFLDFLLMFVSM